MLAGGRRGRVATVGAGRWRALPQETRRFRVGGAMEGLEGEEVEGCGPGIWSRPAAAVGPSTPVRGRRGQVRGAGPLRASGGPDRRSPAAPDAEGPVILRLPAQDDRPRRFATRILILPPAHACKPRATVFWSCWTPGGPVTASGRVFFCLQSGSSMNAQGLPTGSVCWGPRVCLHTFRGQFPDVTVPSMGHSIFCGKVAKSVFQASVPDQLQRRDNRCTEGSRGSLTTAGRGRAGPDALSFPFVLVL